MKILNFILKKMKIKKTQILADEKTDSSNDSTSLLVFLRAWESESLSSLQTTFDEASNHASRGRRYTRRIVGG